MMEEGKRTEKWREEAIGPWGMNEDCQRQFKQSADHLAKMNGHCPINVPKGPLIRWKKGKARIAQLKTKKELGEARRV
jgi:hypothetical protein